MTRIVFRPALAAAALGAILALGACVADTANSQGGTRNTVTSQQADAALQTRVSAFEAELNRGRMVATFDFLPPRMKAASAKMHGLSQADMRAMMTSMSVMAARDGKWSADLDMSKARFGTAANGAPYALIPATANLGANSSARQATILALQETGTWYLIPLDSPDTAATVKSLYPEFGPIALPTG